MHCPFCAASDSKVIDSRLVNENNQVRRRRECAVCKERFTTYEIAELVLPRIIKNDGRRSPFDESKLRVGMLKALEKRPVGVEAVDAAVNRIVHKLRSGGEKEVSSNYIGELVMRELRAMDQVAYVRFASVYRSFQDINAFKEEIDRLEIDQEEINE
jgi:transcriptional repressor NrdR